MERRYSGANLDEMKNLNASEMYSRRINSWVIEKPNLENARQLKGGDLLQFPRKQVVKTVFLNDSNCYWQSTCWEEIVRRASFQREFFFLTSLLMGVVFLFEK